MWYYQIYGLISLSLQCNVGMSSKSRINKEDTLDFTIDSRRAYKN